MSERREEHFNTGVFAALTVCSVYPAMMYGADTGGVSLAAFFTAQIVLTAAAVSGGGLASCAVSRIKNQTGGTSLPRAALLVVYLFYACVILTEFLMFLSSFTHPSARMIAFAFAFSAAAAWAASRGISALCRSAVIFLAVNFLIGVIGCAILASRVKPAEFSRINVTVTEAANALGGISPQLFTLPLSLVLFEEFPRKPYRTYLAAASVSGVFCILMSVLSFGALGGYSLMVRYPFYAAAQTVGVGAFQRLDVIFLCARCVGAFLSLSMLFCAIGKAGEGIVPQKNMKFANTIIAAAAAAVSLAAALSKTVGSVLLDRRVLTAAAVFSAFLVPAAALIGVPSGRRIRRGAAALLCVGIIMSVFAGCDKVQLQDRLIIKGVGIDLDGEKYTVTAQYVDNFSDGDKQKNKAVAVEGESVSAALSKLKDSTGSEPFFGQNSAVVLSECAAEGGLLRALGYFVRYSESRPTVRLYLCKGKAHDIMTFGQNGEITPIDSLTSISPSSDPSDNRFTVLSVCRQLDSETDTPCAACLAIENGTVRLCTAAAVTKGKVRKLSADEYLTYCLLTAVDSEAVITAGGVSCEIDSTEIRVYPSLTEGKLRFSAECRPTVCVPENGTGLSDREIEKLFSEYLTKLAERSAKKIVNGEQTDIFGFGRRLSLSEINALGGEEGYRRALEHADVNVTVECRVMPGKALR